MRYTATPHELLEHIRTGEEAPSSERLREIAAKRAKWLREDHPQDTEYLYGPDTMRARVIRELEKETAGKIDVLMNVYDQIIECRNAFAQALRNEGLKVHQAQQDGMFTAGHEDPLEYRGFIRLKDCDLGYKISRPMRIITEGSKGECERKIIQPLPRDFSGMHPNLMPERIELLTRPVHSTMVTFAPFMEGIGTLDDASVQQLSIHTRTKILLRVLIACVTMHNHGYAHYDIKPDNIFLNRGEDGGIDVYLGDLEGAFKFGISQTMLETPAYSQHSYYQDTQGRIKAIAVDMFALAMTGVEVLFGADQMKRLVRSMGIRNRKEYTWSVLRPREKNHRSLNRFFTRQMKEQQKLPEEKRVPEEVMKTLHRVLRFEEDIATTADAVYCLVTAFDPILNENSAGQMDT